MDYHRSIYEWAEQGRKASVAHFRKASGRRKFTRGKAFLGRPTGEAALAARLRKFHGTVNEVPQTLAHPTDGVLLSYPQCYR